MTITTTTTMIGMWVMMMMAAACLNLLECCICRLLPPFHLLSLPAVIKSCHLLSSAAAHFCRVICHLLPAFATSSAICCLHDNIAAIVAKTLSLT
jgi:hypothetical protein